MPYKDDSDRAKHRAAHARWMAKPGNLEIKRAATLAWVTANPRKRRNSAMRSQYSISLLEYEALLAAQGFACATCGHAATLEKPLSIDHDHGCCAGIKSCGRCIRGLLCRRCNSAIGMAREDRNVLKALVSYLGPAERSSE